MRYVAAYLLAALGGKAQPSADDIKKILASVGVEADQAKLDKVMSELKDKNIEEVIAAGSEKLASVPSGGGAVAAGGAPAAAGGAAEAKKEPEPEPEEEDEDMGFDLFD
eukprot:TRINITY_DN3266_c0_g2_i5.p2 TRINITY_DN3266_c0_g2~~TRINITY_DN3266_c0_g2_i5.p2  ORF type:complete len:109 (+),score=29.57 TRINITY_DN3266_c0_g2_i5:20-346(+)